MRFDVPTRKSDCHGDAVPVSAVARPIAAIAALVREDLSRHVSRVGAGAPPWRTPASDDVCSWHRRRSSHGIFKGASVSHGPSLSWWTSREPRMSEKPWLNKSGTCPRRWSTIGSDYCSSRPSMVGRISWDTSSKPSFGNGHGQSGARYAKWNSATGGIALARRLRCIGSASWRLV